MTLQITITMANGVEFQLTDEITLLADLEFQWRMNSPSGGLERNLAGYHPRLRTCTCKFRYFCYICTCLLLHLSIHSSLSFGTTAFRHSPSPGSFCRTDKQCDCLSFQSPFLPFHNRFVTSTIVINFPTTIPSFNWNPNFPPPARWTRSSYIPW